MKSSATEPPDMKATRKSIRAESGRKCRSVIPAARVTSVNSNSSGPTGSAATTEMAKTPEWLPVTGTKSMFN